MVILIDKNEQNLARFKANRPKCWKCEIGLYKYMQQEGTKVWRRGGNTGSGVARGYGHRVRYYCDDCKKDLFEGVKLR